MHHAGYIGTQWIPGVEGIATGNIATQWISGVESIATGNNGAVADIGQHPIDLLHALAGLLLYID